MKYMNPLPGACVLTVDAYMLALCNSYSTLKYLIPYCTIAYDTALCTGSIQMYIEPHTVDAYLLVPVCIRSTCAHGLTLM